MSTPRIDPRTLADVIRDAYQNAGRPLTRDEIASAYQARTGETFSSDSFKRHLVRLRNARRIAQSKTTRGYLRYAPTPHTRGSA